MPLRDPFHHRCGRLGTAGPSSSPPLPPSMFINASASSPAPWSSSAPGSARALAGGTGGTTRPPLSSTPLRERISTAVFKAARKSSMNTIYAGGSTRVYQVSVGYRSMAGATKVRTMFHFDLASPRRYVSISATTCTLARTVRLHRSPWVNLLGVNGKAVSTHTPRRSTRTLRRTWTHDHPRLTLRSILTEPWQVGLPGQSSPRCTAGGRCTCQAGW